ncbi:MAG: patatin-like phospholipase family protein [Candidatus Marinimicrobia bacterium]|nr:patatin-like phospholipase family protein [Candidatus Neomarinimicrobiota bacterium]
MKWALVLSGGGGNGLAHIGVLKELERMELKPDLVVGNSMGSVVGGVYASGRSPAWMRDYMVNEFDIRKAISLQSVRWGEGPVVKALLAGEALNNLRNKMGAESGKKIVEKLRYATGNMDISNTPISFACNAVDIISGKEKVFTTGNLAKAIRCSISVPPFFEPYEWGNGLYIDGGFFDNLPTFIAHDMGYNKILSVDVVPLRPVSKANIKNGMDVIFRAFTITVQNLHHRDHSTVSLTAYKGAYNYDFDHVDELIEVGEAAVRNKAGEIRKKFTPWYK